MANKKARVYIIGAGPGSAQLISLRGLLILRQADCVLYDRLVGRELLSFCSPNAELVYAGKGHKGKELKQKDINRLLIKKARTHRIVARLKGGDAMIFGRASEELKCLVDNKIDFEIIPGITAASAAAACSGIVLTDRNTASAVTFVTGQTADGNEIDIDFESLAKLNGTIVFYMAVANMKQICRKLVKAGLAAGCKAVVVANASLKNQKIVIGTVSDITGKCIKEGIKPPAVMIIYRGVSGFGSGLRRDKTASQRVGKNCISYLADRPLFGRKVLITRDSIGNAELACEFAARGAQAIDYPTFELQDLTGTSQVRQTIKQIKNFDWVFFTSPVGVRLFFVFLRRHSKDARIFASSKIACIGSETASTLNEFGIRADFIPEEFTSKELADAFLRKHNPAGQKILLLRSALADSALAEKLKSAEAEVKQVSIYTAKKRRNKIAAIAGLLRHGGIDWITFASSFAVDCFFKDFRPKDINKKIKIASIGPVTTESLKKYGVKATAEAKEHTIAGMVKAMEKVES